MVFAADNDQQQPTDQLQANNANLDAKKDDDAKNSHEKHVRPRPMVRNGFGGPHRAGPPNKEKFAEWKKKRAEMNAHRRRRQTTVNPSQVEPSTNLNNN